MSDKVPLRADSSKFIKPSMVNEEGKSLFAETSAEPVAQDTSEDGAANPFTSSSQQRLGDVPYAPQFQTTMAHRGTFLIILATVSLVGQLAGILNIFFVYSTNAYMLPLVSFPLNLAISVLAFQDLRALRFGAMDQAGFSKTRLGYWIAMLANFCFFGYVVYWLQSWLVPLWERFQELG